MVAAIELKAFVPAKDFAMSKAFYADLGFTENWSTEDLAEFQCGQSKFLLQNFYEQKLAENLMMQLMVTDCDEWWARIEKSKPTESFSNAKAKAPEVQPWGQRVLYVWDPSGVLWHIAEPIK